MLSLADTYELQFMTYRLTAEIATLEQSRNALAISNCTLHAQLRSRAVLEGSGVREGVAALEKEIEGRLLAERLVAELREGASGPREVIGMEGIEFYQKLHESGIVMEKRMKAAVLELAQWKRQHKDTTQRWADERAMRVKIEEQRARDVVRIKELEGGVARERRSRETYATRNAALEAEVAKVTKALTVSEEKHQRQHQKDGKELARLRHVFDVACEKFKGGAGALKQRVDYLEEQVRNKSPSKRSR